MSESQPSPPAANVSPLDMQPILSEIKEIEQRLAYDVPGFQSRATPENTNIFALDGTESFAGTSVETWNTVQPMISDLKELAQLASDRPRDFCLARKDVEQLYRKYPLLEYVEREPAPGNPYLELRARVVVWRRVYFYLGYSLSEEKRQAPDAFWEFMKSVPSASYRFIWPRAHAVMKYDLYFPNYSDSWVGVPTLAQDFTYFHYLALDELWAFSQNLKLKQLTPCQEQDRQRLEDWIASEVNDLLIEEECLKLDPAMEYDCEIATQIVEARIANRIGRLATPGAPYQFSFNGI